MGGIFQGGILHQCKGLFTCVLFAGIIGGYHILPLQIPLRSPPPLSENHDRGQPGIMPNPPGRLSLGDPRGIFQKVGVIGICVVALPCYF